MRFKILLAFMTLGIIFQTSCTKENIDVTTTDDTNPPITTVLCDSTFIVNLAFDEATSTINTSIIEGVAPYTYLWSTAATAANITVSETGEYNVTVTDSEGCTAENLLFVDLNDPCDDFSVVIEQNPAGLLVANSFNGTLPITYNWSNGDTSGATTPITGGEYMVTIVDAEGCTATATFNYTAPCESLVANIQETSPNTLQATATGGTLPYSYTWSTGSTEQTIDGLTLTALYGLTVTDAAGCQDTTSFLYNLPCESLSVIINETSPAELLATPSGGTAPYLYVWSEGSTNNPIDVFQSGTYFLTVVDSEGCETENQITVDLCNDLVVDISWNPATGVLASIIYGGTAPYTYVWSKDGVVFETIASVVPTMSGTYEVVVTDETGCSFTDEITITL